MVKFSTKIHRKRDLIKVILGFIEHYFFKKKNKLQRINRSKLSWGAVEIS